MGARFQVELRKSHGNLHVKTKGDFNGRSAWDLINLLHEKYEGYGRVFIDTHSLEEMCPFGCGTFKNRLDTGLLPADRIYFKGENGFKIAPDGCRVILNSRDHRCRCDGNCANCRCANRKNRN